MTRTGKIARLPRGVRTELNRRLQNGEAGKKLVAWLNAHPAVKAVLKDDFGGRPISEQNLSEWKQGGYEDWRRHAESMQDARTLLEEAEDYEDLAGDDGPLTDRLAEQLAVALGHLLRECARMENGPEKRRAVLGIANEIIRLRQSDRDCERAARADELHERERDDYWAEKQCAAENDVEWKIALGEVHYNFARTKKQECEARGEPVPQDVTDYLATEDEFKMHRQKWREQKAALAVMRLTKSDLIRPDHTFA